jgi:phosphoenolpyruvate phosphomutase
MQERTLIISFQKTTQLKQMLNSKDLEFIMEAHNGLSARIVQEAGTINESMTDLLETRG